MKTVDGRMTKEQIRNALRPIFQSEDILVMAIKMSLDEYRAIEAEARKESAKRIAELERQLLEARKLIEEAPTFFTPQYDFGGRKLVWLRSAAIAAKEQP